MRPFNPSAPFNASAFDEVDIFEPLLLHDADRQTAAVMVDFTDPPTRAIYRASFPTTATPTEIPALSRLGLAVLVLAQVTAGTWYLARR